VRIESSDSYFSVYTKRDFKCRYKPSALGSPLSPVIPVQHISSLRIVSPASHPATTRYGAPDTSGHCSCTCISYLFTYLQNIDIVSRYLVNIVSAAACENCGNGANRHRATTLAGPQSSPSMILTYS